MVSFDVAILQDDSSMGLRMQSIGMRTHIR